MVGLAVPTRVSRRTFLGSVATGAGALLSLPAWAQRRSTVILARADDLMSPAGAPDPARVLDLLSRAVTALSGDSSPESAWQSHLPETDRVAFQVATRPLAVAPELVDAVVTAGARAGVSPDREFVYSEGEQDLYRAGYAIRREGPGVRCYGASSEGYRDTITALLGSDVTAIVNMPCLSPHPEAGLAGALRNYVNAVRPTEAREAERNGGAGLPAIAAERALRSRSRVHVMDCLQPAYDLLGPTGSPVRWTYNGLLVSTDPVALDAVATHLLLAKRREVKGSEWPLRPYPLHIELAASQYKLGVADLASIDIVRVGPTESGLI
jgi:Domain of unknown function (DUF362)